jgi:hypothetical protein
MDKTKNKRGFYAYRKLTKSQRRAFKQAYGLERKHDTDKRKKAGLKNVEPFIGYLRDTYLNTSDFILFGFAWNVSPKGAGYWSKIKALLTEKTK